jgi:hypothetical protein
MKAGFYTGGTRDFMIFDLMVATYSRNFAPKILGNSFFAWESWPNWVLDTFGETPGTTTHHHPPPLPPGGVPIKVIFITLMFTFHLLVTLMLTFHLLTSLVSVQCKGYM